MRDYGMVSPRFWIGETGRKLRKLPDAQRVAMYLLTAPMADMNCPHFARQIFDQSGVQACRTTASLYCLGER